MQFEQSLWEVEEVQNILTTVKAILKKELITMDYTAEGNSYRKQFACPLPELLEACQEFLLKAPVAEGGKGQSDSSHTSPFFLD